MCKYTLHNIQLYIRHPSRWFVILEKTQEFCPRFAGLSFAEVLRHQVTDLEELCKSPALAANDRRLYEQEVCVMKRQQAGESLAKPSTRSAWEFVQSFLMYLPFAQEHLSKKCFQGVVSFEMVRIARSA